MTSVSICAAFKILQVRMPAVSVRRNQSHRVANRTERRIDGVSEQMNFNRLTLAGNDQSIFAGCHQIFRAFRNPFGINACRNLQPMRAVNCSRNRRRNLPNQTRRHAQPMIRIRAGEREQRFHRVKPAHPLARLAAGGKFADVIVRVVLAAEKIAVERQDDLRLVEMENRLHRLAERLRRRALMDAGINRVVGEPLRFRKFVAR